MREIEPDDRRANIIGIDLGLTEVRVARFNEAGMPEITNNYEGSDTTPAVVHIDDMGKVIIGSEAQKFLGTNSTSVFAEFKREMGSGRTWNVGSHAVTPTDLTALVLKKVVSDYVQQFGQPTHLAITWPANFRDEQRKTTKEAAERAGIKVDYFIEEPTAAALYCATERPINGKFIIYDIGATSLEVTLVESAGNTIGVLSQEGVQQLGEKDFHNAFRKIIADKFRQVTGNEFDAVDCNFDKLAVESSVSTLCTRSNVKVRLASGRCGQVPIDVTRQEFDSGINHLVLQGELVCDNVLRCGTNNANRHVKRSEIREIFMIGRAARFPALQTSVERIFGKKPKIKNPDQAVALGAAIYAAHKAGGGTLRTTQVVPANQIEVTLLAPHYFGLIYTNWLTGESTNVTIIRKGEKLPFRRTFKIKADARGYSPTFSLTQSAIEEANPEFVTTIWSGELQCRKPNAEMQLVFCYDEHGMMGFYVTETDTGVCTKVELKPAGNEH
jgi:molecular chaperone DnaK